MERNLLTDKFQKALSLINRCGSRFPRFPRGKTGELLALGMFSAVTLVFIGTLRGSLARAEEPPPMSSTSRELKIPEVESACQY